MAGRDRIAQLDRTAARLGTVPHEPDPDALAAGCGRRRLRRPSEDSARVEVAERLEHQGIDDVLDVVTRDDGVLAGLAPGGVIAVHISNRFFDLAPIVSRLGERAGLQAHRLSTSVSTWMLLSDDRAPAALQDELADPAWRLVEPDGSAPLTHQLPSLAIIVLAEVWKTTPFMALLLLAGLALVPFVLAPWAVAAWGRPRWPCRRPGPAWGQALACSRHTTCPLGAAATASARCPVTPWVARRAKAWVRVRPWPRPCAGSPRAGPSRPAPSGVRGSAAP